MANKLAYQITANGDAAFTILIDWQIGERLTRLLVGIIEKLITSLGTNCHDIILGYQSLTVCYFFDSNAAEKLLGQVKDILTLPVEQLTCSRQGRQIPIQVCYHQPYAPDLLELAKACGLTAKEVVERHSQARYLVHLLGVMPGFLYLGGLDKKLCCPRKKQPRTRIPAGSVAIGGNQTGIYPVASPGGWHIIGRTPSHLFNPQAKQPFVAEPLDIIQFSPISVEQFEQLASKEGH